MFTRLQTEPGSDLAAAFRDGVRRLGHPERQRTEAMRVRVMLARCSRVGLRERLEPTRPVAFPHV